MFKNKKGIDGMYYAVCLLIGIVIGVIIGLKLSAVIDPGILPF